jgi:uncharacterized protein YegL
MTKIHDAHPVLPVYLLIDASFSVAADLKLMNESVQGLIDGLAANPVIADSVYLTVVSFSDTAEINYSGFIQGASFTPVQARGGTSFSQALKLLHRSIGSDVHNFKTEGLRVYRPLVYLLTDGVPDSGDPWLTELELLNSPGNRSWPRILAFGFGSAEPTTIRRLAGKRGRAFVISNRSQITEAIKSIFTGLTASVTGSFDASVQSLPSPAAAAMPEDWIELSDSDGFTT